MSGTSGSTYILEGDSSELRQHANQQVEIRGRLDSSSASSSATTSARSSASDATAQRVHVESVREIASSCSSR
jgi:hypothetical protein